MKKKLKLLLALALVLFSASSQEAFSASRDLGDYNNYDARRIYQQRNYNYQNAPAQPDQQAQQIQQNQPVISNQAVNQNPQIYEAPQEVEYNNTYTDYDRILDDDWITSITWENDFFAGDDDNYTNGGRISFLSPETTSTYFIEKIAGITPFFNKVGRKRISYSFGQDMYTPKHIFTDQLVPHERPYAGFLYGSMGLISDTGKFLERLELTLGVVGNSSLAFQVQREIHTTMGILVPKGWKHQLEDEPGLIISYEAAYKEYLGFGFWGLGMDVTPKAGFSLGNVFTHAATGATLRLGRDLPQDYGPPKIRPRMPGSDYFAPTKNWGMYLFADSEVRAVAHNIFLDGNTWKDSHSVDKKSFVYDFQLGAALTIQKVRIAYTHIFRSKEYNGQDRDFDNFSAVTVSVRY